MIFTFEESRLPNDPPDKKYVRRQVTAQNEARARSRLPKSHVGRTWKLVGSESKEALLEVDGVRFLVPAGPVPLRDEKGRQIGTATINNDGTVDGKVDRDTPEGLEAWEKMLIGMMGLNVSVAPTPAVQFLDGRKEK